MIGNLSAMSFYSVNTSWVIPSASDVAKQLPVAIARNSLAATSAGENITTAATTNQFPFAETRYY